MATYRDLLDQLKRFPEDKLDKQIVLLPESLDDILYGSNFNELSKECDIEAIVADRDIVFWRSDMYFTPPSDEEKKKIIKEDNGFFAEEDYEEEVMFPKGTPYLKYKYSEVNVKK